MQRSNRSIFTVCLNSSPCQYVFISAGNIPPGVSQEAYQWFQTVDSDHSGFINYKELKQALVNSNWSAFNDETCLMMISESQRKLPGPKPVGPAQ